MRISDWSSDVCSSDLAGSRVDRFRRDATTGERTMRKMQIAAVLAIVSCLGGCATYQVGSAAAAAQLKRFDPLPEKGSVYRSDERRVGNACVRRCRSLWLTYH